MSLFPRFTQEFSPFFRLLDDYDRASRDTLPGRHNIRAWAPKFDVKEIENAFELHGELPGIDQKDINIEWSDSNTLTISGHIESRHEAGEPPRGRIEEADKHEYQKPTVEEVEASKPAEESAIAKASANKEIGKPTNTHRFWVTERSVGEFHRAFSFPGHVDHDGIKASLKNGILSIVVPKVQRPQARRINIE